MKEGIERSSPPDYVQKKLQIETECLKSMKSVVDDVKEETGSSYRVTALSGEIRCGLRYKGTLELEIY